LPDDPPPHTAEEREWLYAPAIGKELPNYYPLEEVYDQLTHEALDDADAGRVVDHQSVKTWFQNLSTGNTSQYVFAAGAKF
jgi:predicted transcriptional regulator